MKQLIKSAIIVEKGNPLNGQKKDIFIEDGIITKIEDNIQDDADEVLDYPNTYVSIGWFDFRANFRDPGNEHQETIESGIKAAVNGGFTAVGLMPQKNPATDNKSSIEYILKQSEKFPVNIYPYGCLSENAEGKEIAEMYDMQQAGAKAFTDGKHAVSNLNLLERALRYAANINSLILYFPNQKDLFDNGQINEGVVSTKLGLKGIPSIAETVAVKQAIALAEYCETDIHFMGVSLSESIKEIKKHNKTTDIAAYQFYFTDDDLTEFDTNLKTLSPLRTKENRNELIELLNSGDIDIICSDHEPREPEQKFREFDHASYGMINNQTFFGSLRYATKNTVSLENLIATFTTNPRKRLNLKVPSIKIGQKADLTIFDPDLEWTFSEKENLSKSKNSPYFNKPLTGKALKTII
ncbi:MAG TPA: dihydroorotase [Flavobacteriales bacterium]|nr:dihydroorotase [Flavobacteriales bacterium]|tara:strand:+ start:69225 stop:70454 length:1230 start_codon:yes stop_codon:yes gene_type:complete